MNVVSNFNNLTNNQADNTYYGQSPSTFYPNYTLHGTETIEHDTEKEREYWTPPSPTSSSPEECRFYQDNISTSTPSERYYNLDSGGYISNENNNKINGSITSISNNHIPYNNNNNIDNGHYNNGGGNSSPNQISDIYTDYCNSHPDYHHFHHHHHRNDLSNNEIPVIRVVKRRNTANKKERRRTQSINNAFADLRECIPNVPADTKLSKIKTLRLATSYIGYLMGVLENEDCGDGFKADLSSHGSRRPANECRRNVQQNESRKAKGRTGWPQHVWALELKQETL
ncbi:uncharacterized protein LOC142332303 isoform X2 [Lycorma delicatula]|uniref:uncharacterized protein LOC142332303 isoform X2 n=1 Tax=Lycorma delicatula TaxID=130591 RepID=UPI003F518186